MAKKVVVTGGTGWLGGAVVKALLGRGHTVVAADVAVDPAFAALAKVEPALTAVSVDLADAAGISALLMGVKPDAIVHCAAIVGVANCAVNPAKAYRVNVEGTVNLFEAACLAGIKRVVNVSTEETYGDFRSPVIGEDHPQNPTSIYGATKLASEQIGRVYARQYGMECIDVRTCWVYGPDLPRPRMPKTYIDAALKGQPLHISTGGDLAVDQVYIDDTVQGVVLALEKEHHRFDAYNVATGEAPTVSEVAQIVNAAIPGADIRVDPGPYYPSEGIVSAKKGALDISRARAELGYAPQFSILKGMEKMIELSRAELSNRSIDK